MSPSPKGWHQNQEKNRHQHGLITNMAAALKSREQVRFHLTQYQAFITEIISSIIRPLGRLNVISRPAKTGDRWSALSGK